jgi:hypothetical protein
VVCAEPLRRKTADGVEILPVQEFLKALWKEELAT